MRLSGVQINSKETGSSVMIIRLGMLAIAAVILLLALGACAAETYDLSQDVENRESYSDPTSRPYGWETVFGGGKWVAVERFIDTKTGIACYKVSGHGSMACATIGK